ncbi:hypothetical protein ACFSCX_20295 [Bacillus salitolerans]|uniref:Uncharacterized protein n=1 Tax=Bacillus salitolerans TaxID=1437434 RepID=A0ABW4LUX6_9BACI
MPNDFPIKDTDVEEMDRIKELEILNELSYSEIVELGLGDTIPHLIFSLKMGNLYSFMDMMINMNHAKWELPFKRGIHG